MSAPRLYLAGLSGAGKSSVAERIGDWLGWPALDVDREVERATGEPIAALWTREGEPAFRAAERETVARLVERDGPAVMALGGGTLEDPESRARLERWGTGVWLDAPPAALVRRLGDRPGARPLLSGKEWGTALARMAVERRPRYATLPWRVESDGLPIEAAAVGALRALEWPEPVEIADGILLGRNALAAAGGLLSGRVPDSDAAVVVATDERVWALHGAAFGMGLAAGGRVALPVTLAEGEAAKTPAGLHRLWEGLSDAGADRDSVATALGGGAACDVLGLAAATFKRGVPLALFPTTLLAQVDAAIGGKNAIDFGGVKNLVGTFHFPALVVLDPLCLLTLEEPEWRAGWAEVVKTGLIGDPGLFDLCAERAEAIAARRLDVVEEAVRRAAAVKAAIVAADPREAGERLLLNLGHTLGHAIEAVSAGRLRHGEAVAIGTVAAARLSVAEGLAEAPLVDRVESALVGLGLPTRAPEGLDPDELLGRIAHDKKRYGGALHAVLPVEPGRAVVREIDPETLRRWVEEALR